MTFKSDSEQDRKAEGADTTSGEGQGDQPFLTMGDRVFQTKDEFVKSWQNAQDHIAQMEAEAAARAEAEAKSRDEGQKELARQILDGLQAQDRKGDQTDHSSNVSLNEDEIAEKVLSKLSAKQTEKEREDNMDLCMSEAESKFGEDFKTVVAAKAKELNMDMDKVDNLAKTAPQAWKELFIPKQSSQSSTSFAANSDQSTQAMDRTVNRDGEDKNFSLKGKSTSQEKEMIYELGKEMGLY
jgi:hypothetical protein